MSEPIPHKRKPVEIFLNSQHQPFRFDTMAEAIGWMCIVNKLEKGLDALDGRLSGEDESDKSELEEFMDDFVPDFLAEPGIQFIYNSGLPLIVRRKIRYICRECYDKCGISMENITGSFRRLAYYAPP